jgi:hypothetical protein
MPKSKDDAQEMANYLDKEAMLQIAEAGQPVVPNNTSVGIMNVGEYNRRIKSK